MEVLILHVRVTDWHQVPEHALLDLDDLFSLRKRLAFDTFYLGLVHVENIISHHGNKRVGDREAVLFEHERVFHVSYFLVEEAGHFVGFEEELACEDFNEQEVASKEALITIILQLPLTVLVEENEFLFHWEQEVFRNVALVVRDVSQKLHHQRLRALD